MLLKHIITYQTPRKISIEARIIPCPANLRNLWNIGLVREVTRAKCFAQLSTLYSYEAKLSYYRLISLLDANGEHQPQNIKTVPGAC